MDNSNQPTTRHHSRCDQSLGLLILLERRCSWTLELAEITWIGCGGDVWKSGGSSLGVILPPVTREQYSTVRHRPPHHVPLGLPSCVRGSAGSSSYRDSVTALRSLHFTEHPWAEYNVSWSGDSYLSPAFCSVILPDVYLFTFRFLPLVSGIAIPGFLLNKFGPLRSRGQISPFVFSPRFPSRFTSRRPCRALRQVQWLQLSR